MHAFVSVTVFPSPVSCVSTLTRKVVILMYEKPCLFPFVS